MATVCFNPVLGFYRVATQRKSLVRFRRPAFQSRVGFLPRRDEHVRDSIRAGYLCFNPVLGFYRVATEVEPARVLSTHVSIPCWVSTASRPIIKKTSQKEAVVFQSRVGFLPRRDLLWRVGTIIKKTCFNPVLGFYRVATHRERSRSRDTSVSIPCWVSTASRPADGLPRLLSQDVSIPCWVSTASRPSVGTDPVRTKEFQSRVGFLPRRDHTPHDPVTSARQFQSRVGFLPRRDIQITPHAVPTSVFQSRVGFLPRRDASSSGGGCRTGSSFNPVLGFYRVATGDQRNHSRLHQLVSIPCWVSTASRRSRSASLIVTALPFQSRVGFLPRRDGVARQVVGQTNMFQSRVGFLPRRDDQLLS